MKTSSPDFHPVVHTASQGPGVQLVVESVLKAPMRHRGTLL
jgi:hypothetical protein